MMVTVADMAKFFAACVKKGYQDEPVLVLSEESMLYRPVTDHAYRHKILNDKGVERTGIQLISRV